MWRATGRRRSQRLISSCTICALAVTMTRKNSRNAPRPVVVRKVQQQQRRRMAQAEHAHHDAPLDLGVAFEEALGVAGQRAQHRNGQEHVHRDEDAEQVEAAQADQHVLQRQHDEEGQQQAAVVAAPRVRQRDEFAQRQEREHAEQQRRTERPRHPRQPEHDAADPQRAQVAPQPKLQVASCSCPAGAASARTPRADEASRPNSDQEQQRDLLLDVERLQRLHVKRRSQAPTTAARARSRNARLSSLGCDLHRHAEGGGAQDRHRHDLALGHDTLHVVDPHRHQLHVGELFGQVVQPALEGLRLALVAARAFGEDDQRVTLFAALRASGSSGSWSSRALAADIHRVEDLARDPVLEACTRSSSRARRSAACACAGLAAARPRSAPSRDGSGGWRNRCAAAPREGSRSSDLVRRSPGVR